MRHLSLAAISTLAVLAWTPVLALDTAPAVAVTLDATKTGPVIDRHLFGQFAEHLGRGVYEGIWVGRDSPIPNTHGIRNDVVAALKVLHVPDVRWPGGCFADEYHWRRGVGPADQRPVSQNPNWGGVPEPNTFGTDEFMDFIQQIGSEAYISVNVGSGTPEEAADWLEYMTAAAPDSLARDRAVNGHPAPYKVAFVGLGNESWGCGGSFTPDAYVTELRRYARFTHNYNPEQKMQRIAVGPDMSNTGYTEAVMKAWKERNWSWSFEGLSLHDYTPGEAGGKFAATGFAERDYAALLKATLHMEDLVRAHSAIMDRYDPDKKVALVVDEWGAWLEPTPGTPRGFLNQQNSQRDAVLAALNLNIFARHADRVRMANIAQMINVLQAMILTDKAKMLLTPTYHVFDLYVPFQDATSIPVAFDGGTYAFDDVRLPRIDAIAARDRTGQVWLAVTNIDPNRPVDIDISALGLSARSAEGRTLAAPHIDSVNTFEAPHTVAPRPIEGKARSGKLILTLAPASVTVVALR